MKIDTKNIPIKNIIIFFGLFPSIVGLGQVYDRVEQYFKEPELIINRISINDHYLSYKLSNLIGGTKRNGFHDDAEFKEPSAQVSITITNPTNKGVTFNGFSLYVETSKSKNAYVFPTYFILNKNINQPQQFNTSVYLSPNKSIEIEFDVLVYKNRDEIFSECASRFSVSFMDQDFNSYSSEVLPDKPSCKYSKFVLSSHKLTAPSPKRMKVYGLEYGYNPLLKK